MELKCLSCKDFNKQTYYCRRLREYFPNGYAMHYYSKKCETAT